jgi:RNA polymerase sigma-70 factor (ECF subfamily)
MANTEQFVRLLMANEEQLYGYVFSLLPNAEDAKDVLQEAAVNIWQHFDEFDPARPFFPWAARFAYYAVLTFRKRDQRSRTTLSEEAIEAVAQDYRAQQGDLHRRLDALRACMQKLPAPARRLLEERYQRGQMIQAIATRTGRSVHTLYKAFEKIRHWLMECVDQVLAGERETA